MRVHAVNFWGDIWIGDSSLKELFPRLHSISNNKNMGDWQQDGWRWKILSSWEEKKMQFDLLNVLHLNGFGLLGIDILHISLFMFGCQN